jgi:hypothetical protein
VTLAKRVWAGCLSLLLCVAFAAAVRAESPLSLTIRVYNSVALGAAEIAALKAAAGPILSNAGTEVTFRICERPSDDPSRVVDLCDDTLKPHEVVVRIIDAPRYNLQLDPLAYGLTYVVPETNRGWLATVFADRISATAARVGGDEGTLVGLVLAHEVGHLLLGQNYHGDAGVMRANWPDQLLNPRANVDWRFSMSEIATIQQNIAMR